MIKVENKPEFPVENCAMSIFEAYKREMIDKEFDNEILEVSGCADYEYSDNLFYTEFKVKVERINPVWDIEKQRYDYDYSASVELTDSEVMDGLGRQIDILIPEDQIIKRVKQMISRS